MKKAFGAAVLAMSLVASVCLAQDQNVLIEQPLTWSVNSVQIVWSVEQGGVSEAKTDYLFNAEQGRDKKRDHVTKIGNEDSSKRGSGMGGKLDAKAQLSSNPATLFGLLGAHVSGSAYTDYNTASESGSSNSDFRQWSDSESQTVRSVLSSSTSDTGMRKIANRRLVFSVDFINHTKSRLIVVDGTGTVPVYCGDVHIGDAQLVAEEKSKATTIAPTHKPISCRFEMPLDDTGKEMLLDNRPVIKIGGGQLIIQSEDGKIKDAISQSMTFPPHFTISVLSEDMQTDWQILCDDDGVSVVTLREALEAINKRVRLQLNAGRSKRVFDIENSRVCNQQINAKNADWTVQIVRIQDEETPIKTLAEILDTKPEMGDKIQFRIVSNKTEKLQKANEWHAKSGKKLPKQNIASKAGDRMVKTVDGIEYAFRWCPAGTFTMGSPETEEGRGDDESQHEVTLTKGFWMMETEVTVGMFRSFTKDTGYESKGNTPYGWTGSAWKPDSKYSWRNPGFSQSDTHPVVCISWDDAVAFCEWLSKKNGFESQITDGIAVGIRLPGRNDRPACRQS